ncbi:murein L,D-transpeptidase catalytic domain family protein [Cytophagaceae bacterium AH-315-L13]|nr:murein L,D-transpeptidase catalytic domain family protein [Cytophagaceae bacterium AH-315-L13]
MKFKVLIIVAVISLCSTQLVLANRLELKAIEALAFCKKNKMDTNFCILIDMGIHSGKNRLFVWDFKANKVAHKGLCSHGSCNGSNGPGYSYEKAVFRNVSGSYCSSIGKYKIGNRGYSNWGVHINYKLHGLESSNSKAYPRIIVLHSYGFVSNMEVYPEYAITSWGCPMVSNEMMKYIDKKLKKSQLPVLLWVYND